MGLPDWNGQGRSLPRNLFTSMNPDPSTLPPPGGPDRGENPEGPNLTALLQALRKRWPLVVGITAFVLLGVTFYTLGQTKIYQATATVMFDPNPPRPLGKEVDAVVDMGSGSYWNNQEYYETQYQLMHSMRIALDVVQQLGLAQDGAFLADAPPGGKFPPATATDEQAAQVILARTTVAPVKNSRLASLSYQDADPARAQRITAALIDTYVQKNLEDAQASTGSAVEWLNGQLDKLKTGLDDSEMALHKYKIDKNMLSADLDDQSNMLRSEMQQLTTALTEVRIKREELTARRDELAKVKADDPSVLPASELLNSSLLSLLRQKYLDAAQKRDEQVAMGKGSNHPDVKGADAEVTASKAALLAEVRNIQGAVDRDLAAVKEQEGGLSGLLDKARSQAFDLNLLGIEYSRLERTKTNSEKLYSIVLERAKEGDLTRMMQVNNIQVVERPLLPVAPVKPRVPVNVLLGLVAGLVLGVGAALGREMLDRSVKSQADLEGAVGVTFLGLLPAISPEGAKKSRYYGYGRRRKTSPTLEGTVSPDLVVHQAPLSGPAEAARSIRTNIQFMSPDRPYKTLLVTSAGPSEGKTTVACSIAIAMAQAGQKVILIDCDLRRPRVHRAFGKTSDQGLTTALLDHAVLTDELVATEIPNLDVLPAGPIPPNPAEIIQSERFHTMLADLQTRYDRIVIDSPPVVPVTDAAILSTQVDGCVLVVRAFKTTRELAIEGRRALQGVGGRIVGAVLNAVDLDRGYYRHYQYQYYRRGGYYRHHNESPTVAVE